MARSRRLLLVACLAIAGASTAADAHAQGDDTRYALAGGCYGLKSLAAGRFVVKGADGRYAASAAGTGAAEPFRMQATALGRYLFYGRKGDFMAAGARQTVPGVPVPPVPPVPASRSSRERAARAIPRSSSACRAPWRTARARGARSRA